MDETIREAGVAQPQGGSLPPEASVKPLSQDELIGLLQGGADA
ncbi:hypothetical protein [Bifidobacterium xylocopae]|nr:hypothetical protein [Bifidobacterium xylocopae]